MMGGRLSSRTGTEADNLNAEGMEHDDHLEHLDSIQAHTVEYAFEPPIKKQLGPSVVVADSLVRVFETSSAAADEDSESVLALRKISLLPSSELYPVRAGEFVVFRGPSGGGKTTLLNLLGALDRPSSGTLTILDQQISSQVSDRELADMRLRRIGFVFQTFNLLPAFSAFENVELPMLLLNKLDTNARRQRATELMCAVGLRDRLHHLPSELSGGEQQRVAIARALANEPQLLLLDEPTGDLDSIATIEIMNLLLEINLTKRTTCIMVTHNPDLECYADRILYILDGTITNQVLNEEQVALTHAKYNELLQSRANNTAAGRERHVQ